MQVLVLIVAAMLSLTAVPVSARSSATLGDIVAIQGDDSTWGDFIESLFGGDN